MKKILWVVILLTVMISCKQEPTKITFENMTCCDYINYNTYYSTYEKSIDDPEVALESYESCEKGITTNIFQIVFKIAICARSEISNYQQR